MFRSPNEISSSDSSSSDNNEIFLDNHVHEGDTDVADESLERQQTSTTDSLPDNGDYSVSPDQTNIASSDQQHSNFITASLLEFHYQVRAAEFLNNADPDGDYTRESPQAKALAKKMYESGSQVLVTNSLIGDGIHGDNLKHRRQEYLAAIDNLGIRALKDARGIPSSSAGAARNLRIGQGNAIVPATARSVPVNGLSSILGSTSVSNEIALHDNRCDRTSGQIHNLALPSPRADMQLSLRKSSISPGLNRYKSDFTEVRTIGRGGFGSVYHAINFVDNQHYAIKKIPLNPKRMKNWQEGGLKAIENLLREIRTLARLEHSNIVRYFGAWIEGGDTASAAVVRGPGVAKSGSTPVSQTQGQKDALVGGVQTNSASQWHPSPKCLDEEDIIFGEDSMSQPASRSGQAVIEENHPTSTSTISLTNDSDIFTDGNGNDDFDPTNKSSSLIDPAPILLHIQMSLHPMTLSTYISPPASSLSPPQQRHCFHLRPSLQILLGILSGVQYLHTQGVIHRDLKPGNIFLSHDISSKPGFVDVACHSCSPPQPPCHLNPRIGDFGLVAYIADAGDLPPSSSLEQPLPKPVGTELYRPSSGLSESDEKLDVFALGILLFELLWRFETKMERHMLLHDLSKEGKLPALFAAKIGKETIRGGKESIGMKTEENAAAAIATCILGMVESHAEKRWGCQRVRECIHSVLD